MAEHSEEFTLTAEEAAALRQGFKYCPRCATEMVDKNVYGRLRRVCPDLTCRFVQFIDPKVSAAIMALRAGKLLLVKRTMDPGRGSWCFPGGFMDIGETPQQTAIRECQEESGFETAITGLVDVYYYEDYRGSGVLIMYKGDVVGGQARTSDEADLIKFFGPDEIPQNLAFESNIKAITAWREGRI